ncbi:MAG: DegT/DnrJ/EryC1/StrS family aminotransferase [Calditrichaeota bacterium]|nr:DegT/DnrJ/EryC1/StrS family aminotransferase [Calditrichota bacterium]
MSALACRGGKPVTKDLLAGCRLPRRRDLERRYLLQAYDSGVWDDWPGVDSMAARFQREWADFHGSAYCALLTNGTHALQVALEALDIGAGDEVIVPGLTWQATAAAVCDVNAVPVLVDVHPETMCTDPAAAERAITPRTRAIIAVHLYHRLADLQALGDLAKKRGLYLIEDCAHVHGSQWEGRGVGTIGVFGSFSFQSSKLITAGEGGALFTQDETLYWRVVSQRLCGREVGPGVRVHSGNYRMTSLQAAVLRGQLAALRRNAPVLDSHGLALDRAVAEAPGVRPLHRDPRITRMCSYAFAFLYEAEAFDGLDASLFRRALSAELGLNFDTTYAPLNQSEVYFPHSKRRHQLSRSYVRAITPSRWELPVAEGLHRHRAVLTPWRILACPPSRAHLLTEAIGKIYRHRHELLALQRRQEGRDGD